MLVNLFISFSVHHLIIMLETLFFIFHFRLKNLNFKYSSPLNNMGIWGADSPSVENPCITFGSHPKLNYSHPLELVPGTPLIAKSVYAQFVNLKWRRKMHKVGFLPSQISSNGLILIHWMRNRGLTVYLLKNICIYVNTHSSNPYWPKVNGYNFLR